MDRKALLLVTFFVEGGLFVIGLVLMGGSGTLQSRFSLSWNATVYSILFSLPMFAALYFSMRSKWNPVVQLKNDIDDKVLPLFSNTKFIDLVPITLFAGAGEELFFRGWLQTVLIHKSGILIGILITSTIFGFLHYLSTTYAIYAFITGVYLGVIYHVSGNLYVVMMIHTLYDFIALIYLVRRCYDESSKILDLES